MSYKIIDFILDSDVQPFLGEDNKYHFIYKIINIKNNKYYIGKHTTSNLYDGYPGSSYILHKYAFDKYGISSFIKIILSFHSNAEDAFLEESKNYNR